MNGAFIILFCGGLLGVADTVVFHILKVKLYKTHIAYWEQLTHVIRIVLYAVYFILICVRATGRWWWLYPAAIAVEAVTTTSDVILEPHTRKTLGGIPPAEYVLHCMILTIHGAALSALMAAAWPYRQEADGLVWTGLDLGAFSWLPYFAMSLAGALFLFEASGFARMTFERLTRSKAELAKVTVT